MGILDSIKKTAADSLKKAAATTVNTAAATSKAAAASSSKAAEAAISKAAALVGSKVADAMINTLTGSPPNATSSPVSAAAAKAAALVGSKAAPKEPDDSSEVSYTESYERGRGTNAMSPAEVEALVEARAREKGMQNANWKHSIVDLMAVLGMNSSLDSRRALAARLNYYGSAADGSAEKNNWLHAELLRILAQTGGEVPWS